METVDLHTESWEGIRNGFKSERLAHAYVIVGSPRGNGLQFAESFLKLLFCESTEKPCNECAGCRQVESHKQVDILWIEPQSKSRQILADDIRALIQRMTQTAFSGGWKAGVILSAECMNTSSENALLKTLEEPPPKSLLLLITDSPQALLPTINSRCQRIVLSESAAETTVAEWHEPLMEILYGLPPLSGLDASQLASRLKGLFDEIKRGIADLVEEELGRSEEALDTSKLKAVLDARTNARLKEVRADAFRVMLDWHRDVLMLASHVDKEHLVFSNERERLLEQARNCTPGKALHSIQVIDSMARRLDRNIPDAQVFDEAFRQLVQP